MDVTRRSLLASIPVALAAGRARAVSPPMWRVQRLAWAGVRIELPGATLFVDPWISPAAWDGRWPRGVVPIRADAARRAVLPTHLHNDHFDPDAIREAVGERGIVICVEGMAASIVSRGLRVRSVPCHRPEPWGDVVVIAVPAADGLGAEQVSWIVTDGTRRLFHGGDTLWHGGFGLIGRAYGPFDVALLPINGAVVTEEPPHSGQPIALGPEAAAAAAEQLRARRVVPIHYGVSTDTYREHDRALESFREAARRRGVEVAALGEGEWLG
jgi:L-ascorbate metabolism protein UlaG (beta-lactamase superfamily)